MNEFYEITPDFARQNHNSFAATVAKPLFVLASRRAAKQNDSDAKRILRQRASPARVHE
jgi:hypothetical protein